MLLCIVITSARRDEPVKVGKYTMSFAPKATAAVHPPAKPSEPLACAADAGIGTPASAVQAAKGNSSSNTERRLTGIYSNLNSST
jgi:hypothetical protein